MTTWIALFRGINVGGNNILPMKELTSLLLDMDFENVRTYIQSGNVVFRSGDSDRPDIASRISNAVEERYGFRIRILIVSETDFQRAIEENPFPIAIDHPKTLHLFFLAATPETPDLAALNNLKLAEESFVLNERMFYLHAPQGIGRSKLAQRAEKLLGVPATARNWRTVGKIAEMARNPDR
ncbi:MAG: DUF1697 domain-containing protein [Gammaproteobacteria bacterium]|nr:DUF1697 domain-containing protein [Gammaproteobacteria bacterium]